MTTSFASNLLMAALMASSLALALQQQQESSAPVIGQQGQAVEQAPQDKSVWPMVDVDRQANKSTVDVHVPIFFDMTNQKDNESGRAKLDLSVLQGLVTVNKDRAPNSNGQMSGPIKVTVFGIPVYQGKSAHDPLDQQQTRSGITDRTQEVTNNIANNLRQTNEKVMRGLSELFGRMSSMVRQASEAIAERRPLASDYERELQQRRQQPSPYEQQQKAQQPQPQAPQQTQPQPPLQEPAIETNQIERLPTRSARDELPRL